MEDSRVTSYTVNTDFKNLTSDSFKSVKGTHIHGLAFSDPTIVVN